VTRTLVELVDRIAVLCEEPFAVTRRSGEDPEWQEHFLDALDELRACAVEVPEFTEDPLSRALATAGAHRLGEAISVFVASWAPATRDPGAAKGIEAAGYAIGPLSALVERVRAAAVATSGLSTPSPKVH
jgi:hypothetical protein